MDIKYDSQGSKRIGFLARPSGRDRQAGILVLHGGGGLGDHAKSRALALAELGYTAFAPDLFGHRVEGLDAAKALTEYWLNNWAGLRATCSEALDVLRSELGSAHEQVGAVGFCFGGQAALELGRSGVPLKCIVGFHSQLQTRRPEDSGLIRAKVLVCLGNKDCFVSGDERDTFMANMTDSQVDCQILLFSGVEHGFTDRYAEASGLPGLKYDAKADARSWAAMTQLFEEAFVQEGA